MLLQTLAQITTTTTTTETNIVLSGAAVVGLIFFSFFIFVLAYVVNAYLLGRIFKKAGAESWPAWVPIYNSWRLLELGKQQGFWAALALIPIVNIVSAVFIIIAMYHVGRQLGKSEAFVLLAIFLPFIWLLWLALDNSTWNQQTEAKANPDTPAQV